MTCEKPLKNILFNFYIIGWHNWNAILLRLGVVRCRVLVPSIAYRWQQWDTCLTLPMLWLLAVASCRWFVLAGWESHWRLFCSPRFTNFWCLWLFFQEILEVIIVEACLHDSHHYVFSFTENVQTNWRLPQLESWKNIAEGGVAVIFTLSLIDLYIDSKIKR